MPNWKVSILKRRKWFEESSNSKSMRLLSMSITFSVIQSMLAFLMLKLMSNANNCSKNHQSNSIQEKKSNLKCILRDWLKSTTSLFQLCISRDHFTWLELIKFISSKRRMMWLLKSEVATKSLSHTFSKTIKSLRGN